jgi:hypothetical protein
MRRRRAVAIEEMERAVSGTLGQSQRRRAFRNYCRYDPSAAAIPNDGDTDRPEHGTFRIGLIKVGEATHQEAERMASLVIWCPSCK